MRRGDRRAKARRNLSENDGLSFLMHADNVEPVALASISFQNDIKLSATIRICKVNRKRSLRHRRHIHIGFLEWQLAQHEHLRTLVDNHNHLAQLYIEPDCTRVRRLR